jgi:hexosaminidase
VRAAAKAQKVSHAAVGKAVTLAAMPSGHYFGLGPKSLADGRISSPDHTSGLWLGFHGDDLEAVIDLGISQPIRRLAGRFLQSIAVGIYLPRKVVFEVSADGKTFTEVAANVLKDVEKGQGTKIHLVTTPALKATGRFVRVRAENVKIIPASHPARGKKAWLFVDELLVNPPDADPADKGS